MKPGVSIRSGASPLARLSTPGRVATLAIAIGIIVLLFAGYSLAKTLFGPRPVLSGDEANPERHAEQQSAAFKKYLAQITGRSLLSIPPPPRPVSEEPPPSDEPSRPPPPPATYGGPAITAMLSDSVWFANGDRLALGKSNSDVEVLALNPPWEATLLWRGVEFKVPLFDRNTLIREYKPGDPTPPPPPPEDDPDDDPPSTTNTQPEKDPGDAANPTGV
jgi:hypothetical protein